MRYGPDELDDPIAALANLKQMVSVSEYHKAFIKLAHMVDEMEKNLISLFLTGLEEDLRMKVKMDKPLSMVATYRSACTRELITFIERRLNKPQTYRNPGSPALHHPTMAKGWAAPAGSKEGGSNQQSESSHLRRWRSIKGEHVCQVCEPFTPGHKCKNRSLMLIESQEVDDQADEEEEILLEPKEKQPDYIPWREALHPKQLD